MLKPRRRVAICEVSNLTKIYILIEVLALVIVFTQSPLYAITLPQGFVESYIATLSEPTAMAFAPDGRLFVCQKTGQLRVIKNGVLLAAPFLTVDVNVTQGQGLIGIAIDPEFATNQYVYVYYTAKTPALHNRISRFTANGDVAVPGSEVILLELDDLVTDIHHAGAMHFGIDGKLYIAVGDNGIGSNAQSLTDLLGKILRINKDGSIPTDNPFYNIASGKNKAIWALGLRNPFTFAIQPVTGRMFINDVGETLYEEINDGIASGNYGWPNTEGYTSDIRYTSPIYAYGHGDGNTLGCAITGGTFYNPANPRFPPEHIGKYFFMDFCNGWIRILDPTNNSVSGFATNISSFLVGLTLGQDGSLYYAYWNWSTAGAIYTIKYTGDPAPQIGMQPVDQLVPEGESATFSISASGAPPLSYQWQRDGVNIPGATSPSYTTPPVTLADYGARFQCMVTNSFGGVTSNSAALIVTTNKRPTAIITSPVEGTLYSAGITVNYQGTGTDPEDGTLPPSAFTWKVDFQHFTHFHPFMPSTSGTTDGSFTIPTVGETSADVGYRISLTVADSGGLTYTTFRDIRPRKSTITLATSPSGLQVKLDDQPHTSPYSLLSVVGMTRTLGVVSPQTVNGITYNFNNWSDGGAATHNISTPASDTTYTAVYHPPPAVVTGAASTITQTGAALNGSANPNGASGIAWFEYGATLSYGSTSVMQAISGSTANPVAISISGLSPSTLYHYRILAQTIAGTSFGADMTFTTASCTSTVDCDGDGLPDTWETQYGLNPYDSTGDNGAGGDPDGDGFTNFQEYQAGTDPRNPNSKPWPNYRSDNYTLSSHSTSGGGGITGPFSYQLTPDVSGQGVAGSSQSSSYELDAGFAAQVAVE